MFSEKKCQSSSPPLALLNVLFRAEVVQMNISPSLQDWNKWAGNAKRVLRRLAENDNQTRPYGFNLEFKKFTAKLCKSATPPPPLGILPVF